MSYIDKRKQIDLLQQEINSHGELSAEVKKKINYKFRLDWNYYSNSMEGNTLTMEETRSVMVGNLTVGGKPIKDVLEMKGHNEVINEILSIGRGELKISEARIKAIHKGIMHEEDEDKKGKIGLWKTSPNHVINYKGEKFDFDNPAEVPEHVHKMLDKTNAAIDAIQQHKKDAPHPLDVALQFHLEFVTIHPFYDGNGRTDRILTNLLLISFGYPPFWVKTDERNIYNQYIADIQGYGGSPDLFFEFAAGLILRSQQLVLDAIAGKDIEEPDDLDKKLSLFDNELKTIKTGDEINVVFDSSKVFLEIYDSWLSDLLKKLIPIAQKFNKYYAKTSHYILVHNKHNTGNSSINFSNENPEEVVKKLREKLIDSNNGILIGEANVIFALIYTAFKKSASKPFSCQCNLSVVFEYSEYKLIIDKFLEDGTQDEEKPLQRLLDQPMTSNEIDKVVQKLGDTLYRHMEFYSKQLREE